MESKFNMDAVYKKLPQVDIKSLEIFRKAALLYHFDVKTDFKEFGEDEIKVLLDHSFKRHDGLYRLRKEDRLEILSQSIGVENLDKVAKNYNIQSDFTEVIKTVLHSSQVNLHEFTNAQLYYAIDLSEIFPRRLNNQEVRRIYQRRLFFKPFARITKNFAGREEELEEISDYVDWMPKSSVMGKIKSAVRNIINWNDKPPLLIKGIGGIGKSTIVAKFILDQNSEKNGKSLLPFVYIDFDLPGFSIREPLTILIEALRQTMIQYPSHRALIHKISERISAMIRNKDEEENRMAQKSTASTRGFIYETIKDVVSSYDIEFKSIGKTPILVVFDSFEEMQYRATSSELHSFFNFIQEVSELIPRVRPIFAGRAEISESFSNFNFRTLTILDFDAISADALLEKWGVDEKATRNFIYDNFGGNPLMLILATDLAKKEGFDLKNPEEIHGKKWEYLITRILGHIHLDEVRKIAVPGMLVRHVNPEVIQEVLAVPTKLGEIEYDEANRIYGELKKEVALISRSSGSDEFSFRQDLRMICESTILEKYPTESKQIREKAVTHYAKYVDIEDIKKRLQHKAEYYYHTLKDGIIPTELRFEEYEEFRTYLEQAIIELPKSGQMFLRSLSGQNVTKESIESSSHEEWEHYHTQLIKEALNGELTHLEDLYNTVRKRKERVNQGFTEFGKYESLLYQRLDKIDLSNERLQMAMNWEQNIGRNDKNKLMEFRLLLVENYEYQERYGEGLNLLIKDLRRNLKVDSPSRKKLYFLIYRIYQRLIRNPGGERVINDELSSTAYLGLRTKLSQKKWDSNTKWEFTFRNTDVRISEFKSGNEFNNEYRSLKRELHDLKTLEEYSYKNIGYFLKDISNTGTFNIVLRDFLFAKELLKNIIT